MMNQSAMRAIAVCVFILLVTDVLSKGGRGGFRGGGGFKSKGGIFKGGGGGGYTKLSSGTTGGNKGWFSGWSKKPSTTHYQPVKNTPYSSTKPGGKPYPVQQSHGPPAYHYNPPQSVTGYGWKPQYYPKTNQYGYPPRISNARYNGMNVYHTPSSSYGYSAFSNPQYQHYPMYNYGAQRSGLGFGNIATGFIMGYYLSSLITLSTNPWRYQGYGYGRNYGYYKKQNNTEVWQQCVARDVFSNDTLINPDCKCERWDEINSFSGEWYFCQMFVQRSLVLANGTIIYFEKQNEEIDKTFFKKFEVYENLDKITDMDEFKSNAPQDLFYYVVREYYRQKHPEPTESPWKKVHFQIDDYNTSSPSTLLS